MACVRCCCGHWARKQAYDAGLWICRDCGTATYWPSFDSALEVALAWRRHCARSVSPESAVGGAPRLAADRSRSQRPTVQERPDQPVAIPRRAGAVFEPAGSSGLAGRSLVVFSCARRKAIPVSGMGLPDRSGGYHDRERQKLLLTAVLSGSVRGRRDSLGTRHVPSVAMDARRARSVGPPLGTGYRPVWGAHPSSRCFLGLSGSFPAFLPRSN